MKKIRRRCVKFSRSSRKISSARLPSVVLTDKTPPSTPRPSEKRNSDVLMVDRTADAELKQDDESDQHCDKTPENQCIGKANVQIIQHI